MVSMQLTDWYMKLRFLNNQLSIKWQPIFWSKLKCNLKVGYVCKMSITSTNSMEIVQNLETWPVDSFPCFKSVWKFILSVIKSTLTYCIAENTVYAYTDHPYPVIPLHFLKGHFFQQKSRGLLSFCSCSPWNNVWLSNRWEFDITQLISLIIVLSTVFEQ